MSQVNIAKPEGDELADTSSSSMDAPKSSRKGLSFWLIMLALIVSLFLSALELSAVSTALPTIAKDLKATDFVWVGTAYALASTAFLPMSGGLAQVFGRRPTMLAILVIFAIGSAICGAAVSMPMLIIGRTIQGIGGGGIQSLSTIILADLVTLKERGVYASAFGVTWSFASLTGPVIGGSLAGQGQWRWLFYLNLPITGVAIGLVIIFLTLPTPPGSMASKISRMDWLGNFLVVSSLCSFMIAMTWGGVTAPWNSAKVLVPLILGAAGLVGFFFYEAFIAKFPLVPFSIMSNRTSLSGYLQTFFSGVVAISLVYWFPVYWQACHEASPVRSGVLTLGYASLAPSAVIAGILVKKTQRYRPQMWTGWILITIGLGLLVSLKFDTSTAKAIGFTIISGVGLGLEYSTTVFPIQAPLPVSQNAPALAFLQFVRSFSSVWGVTIGITVLQNQLKQRLPSAFLESFPGGVAIAYSLIPEIPSIPPSLQGDVKIAFAHGLSILWIVMCGISAVGFASSLLMRGLPLHSKVDEEWTLKERPRSDVLHLPKS